MAILNVINNEISLAQGLSQIQLSGNTATVQLMSLELKQVSSIVAELEASPIVSYVGVDTAAMDEQGSLARRSGSLVAATLTIEFTSGTGQAVQNEESEESLTDQLAARKAAVESMGEE
jgi:predicted phage gp36 major capsid-like protein